MKVVLSPNPYRDRGLRAAQAAEKILRNVGVEIAMCLPFLLEGSNLEFPKHIQFKDTQEELKNADMPGLLRRRRNHPPRGQGRQRPQGAYTGGQSGQRGFYG